MLLTISHHVTYNRYMFQDDCWWYAGIINAEGYGLIQVKLNGKWTLLRAHRVLYENLVGEIPSDVVCDHTCRNRCCINPVHIELVTNAENLRRGHERLTHCKHGHPFSIENTMLWRDKKWRRCRTCFNAQRRRYYHKRKNSHQLP